MKNGMNKKQFLNLNKVLIALLRIFNIRGYSSISYLNSDLSRILLGQTGLVVIRKKVHSTQPIINSFMMEANII